MKQSFLRNLNVVEVFVILLQHSGFTSNYKDLECYSTCSSSEILCLQLILQHFCLLN